MLGRFAQKIIGLLKAHTGGGSREDKPCLVIVRDKKCLLDLFYKGLLERIAFTGNVCGLSLVYVRVPLGKALRRVRSDELNLEVQLERTYSAKVSEEHRLLLALEQSLIRQSRALKFGLLLHPCSYDLETLSSIVSEIEAYGCKASLYCGSFFRGKGEGA